jgi:protein AbiQ
MLNFYFADTNYVNYLRTIESKVPYQDYANHDKFVCGILIAIDDIKYYAPVSHYSCPDQTSFPIKNKRGNTIASIRTCFMFPIPDEYITLLNFRELTITDRKYTDLVRTEYDFCKKNEAKIIKHAQKIHRNGSNRSLYIAKYINDFNNLEEHYIKYNPAVIYESPVAVISAGK